MLEFTYTQRNITKVSLLKHLIKFSLLLCEKSFFFARQYSLVKAISILLSIDGLVVCSTQ